MSAVGGKASPHGTKVTKKAGPFGPAWLSPKFRSLLLRTRLPIALARIGPGVLVRPAHVAVPHRAARIMSRAVAVVGVGGIAGGQVRAGAIAGARAGAVGIAGARAGAV